MAANTNNLIGQTSETFSKGYSSLSDSISSAKESLNSSVDDITSNVEGSSSFLDSNTLVVKFGFLILVVIIFTFLIRVGITLIAYFSQPSQNPYVVKGLLDGTEPVMVSQDPKSGDYTPIYRSNNESTGLEFTWGVWLRMNKEVPSGTKYSHIFSKGDAPTDDGLTSVNNSPGLYYGPDSNKLFVKMNTVKLNDPLNTLEIDNIPINKWFHVAIRMKNTVMDVYINGTIAGRVVLDHTPKQNYQDVLVNQNGGFPGKLSDLRYFSKALNVFEVNSIVNAGPDMTTSKFATGVGEDDYYGYLSNMWYTSKM
jgi:hypothetical protein